MKTFNPTESYSIAADFGDLPPFEEYVHVSGDTDMFEGYQLTGLEVDELEDPVERAEYAAWLKDKGFSGVFKNEYHDKQGRFTSKENDWKKVGSQKGSNPGGVYEKDGAQHYIKFPNAKGQSLAEDVADKIHEAMGAKTMQHEMHTIGGKEASVSKFNDQMQILGKSGWDSMSEADAHQAAKIVMASMLVKNWDVVGLAHDNMAKNKKTGDLHIVDTGGSFNFRAQGEHKSFDHTVESEISGMLSKEKTSGRVVKPMFDKYPQAFKAAADELGKLTRADFEKLTASMNSKAVVDSLLERQAKLLKHFG